MLPVALRLHPPVSRDGDRCRIDRPISGEFKSMGDNAQGLCQVLERNRRETDGGTRGQVALTFFNQGGFSMTSEHPAIRKELLKHSWISSARVRVRSNL
jgi:hypothetical protein